jgi:hypothetical protein
MIQRPPELRACGEDIYMKLPHEAEPRASAASQDYATLASYAIGEQQFSQSAARCWRKDSMMVS